MKFVIISLHKDSLYALSPEKRVDVLKGATAFADKYIKTGKCKDVYFHGDMKGTVSIWELQSSEEAARLTLENPMSPFLDIESNPLIEYEVGKKVRMEAFEKIAKK